MIDKEGIVDNRFVTSRSPKDPEAFSKKLIEEIGEGIHTPLQHIRSLMITYFGKLDSCYHVDVGVSWIPYANS